MGDLLGVLAVVVVILLIAVWVAPDPAPKKKSGVLPGLGVGLLVAGLAVALLLADEIAAWFDGNRRPGSTGELIREALDNGNFNYAGHIFDGVTHSTLATESWLDKPSTEEMDRRFGRRNRVTWYAA